MKEIQLYEHQKQVVDEDKKWFGNWRGTGSGKTLTTIMLAEGNTLVITPKTLYEQQMWINEAKEFGIEKPIKQISKEIFKNKEKVQRLPINIDTIVVDEAHHFFGVHEAMKKKEGKWYVDASISFCNLLYYIRLVKPKRLYLLTATPTGNQDPMKLYSIAKLLGYDWDFQKFRDKYYTAIPNMRKVVKNGKVNIVRQGTRYTKTENPDLQKKLVSLFRQFGYTGSLFDFSDVPEQTHKVVYFDLNNEQKKEMKEVKELLNDPNKARTIERSIENGRTFKYSLDIEGKEEKLKVTNPAFYIDKYDYILERAEEFPKLTIFADYTAQVNFIAKMLRDAGYKVFTLDGSTKDRTPFSKYGEANTLEKCICVIQASVTEGYSLTSYPVAIFASESNKVRDKIQAIGRLLRGDNLKKNLFITLVTRGGRDEDCYQSIKAGRDFSEKTVSGIK